MIPDCNHRFIKMLEEATGFPLEDNEEFAARFESIQEIFYPLIHEEIHKAAFSFLENEVIKMAKEGLKNGKYKSESDAIIKTLTYDFRDFITAFAAYREASLIAVYQILKGRLQGRPKDEKPNLRLVATK